MMFFLSVCCTFVHILTKITKLIYMYEKRRKSSSGAHNKNNGHKSGSKNKNVKKPVPERIGTIKMTREGYGFVIVEGEEDDIYVKASKMRGALNGDKVRVAVTKSGGGKKGGHSREGEVREIIERTKKPFIGILHIVGEQAWLLMQSKSMPYDICLAISDPSAEPVQRALRPCGNGEYSVGGVYETVGDDRVELKCHKGMKIAAVVDRWARGETNPHGLVVDVLGEMGDNNTEMHAILAEYGLPYRFEPEVANAADKISDKITDKDLKGRKDFRNTLTFTIDPADAKDFDDALSFKKLENGNYEVGVHIADVSYYVTPGSVVDKEAQERGTSVYLVDRTVPMLPEKLSNKLCSLRPNEDKLTFSAVFEITPKGKEVNHWFGRTIICSDYRFAYETAQQIIDAGQEAMSMVIKGGTDGKSGNSDVFGISDGCVIPDDIKEAILILWGLASILRDRRFKEGAVSFERPEMKVVCDENGKPIDVYQKISKEANWLIEEFMLLANRSVAEFIATGGKMDGKARKNAKTFVYRVHDEPNSQKLSGLSEFAGNFGYKTNFGAGNVSKNLNELLDSAKDKPEFMPIQMLALRSMAKAKYSTDNIGHYGLAFKYYTHFTSPIRRYPDTMVHRLLSMYLDNAPSQDKNYYEGQCEHASEREVIAANAERDSIKYKQVEFMEDKIGQEFEGHISSLTEWGMYVEIARTKIEGMVSLRVIKSELDSCDDEHYELVGRRSGKVYRLGDPVRIKVAKTSLDQRILDYELVEDEVHGEQHRKDEVHGEQHRKKAANGKAPSARRGSGH